MTPERAKHLLWERGETGYKLHAGQQRINDAYESTTWTVFGAECARQFGKTCWGVWLADKIARQFPGCSVRIATAKFNDIEPFIMPAFRWLFSDCPEQLRPTYLTSKAKWLYRNGSEIQLVGLDLNPNKLRGNRLRLILVEEAGFTDSEKLRYVYESVIIPATTHEPDARVVLISTPPESGSDHSFCELVDEAALEGSYAKLTIYDNPLLTPERVDELALKYAPNTPGLSRDERVALGKASIAFRRECLCERIVDTTRAVIPEFSEACHVKETPKPPYFHHLHRYAFLDSGVRDQTVVLLAWYDFPRAKLVVEDEIVLQGKDVLTSIIAERTKSKELERWGRSIDGEPLAVYDRVADNNNLILIQDLSREHNLSFRPTSKDSLEAMVNALRLWFTADRIEINPRCKHLIGTLRGALWTKNRDDFARSNVFGHCDALAALMYGVRNVNTSTNPFPSHFGIDLPNTFINPLRPDPSRRPSKEAQAFIDSFARR